MLAKDDSRVCWNRFVDLCDMGTIFHRFGWSEFLSRVYGYGVYNLIAFNGKEIVGVLPLVSVNSRLFGRRLISVPFADYGGPCLKDGSESVLSKFLVKVKALSTDADVDYVEFRASPSPLMNEMLSNRYEVANRYCTFNLNLTGTTEPIWRGFNKKVRNAIRKAEKNDLSVFDAQTRENLKDYYLLYLLNMRRLGSPPHSFLFFDELWREFSSKGFIKVLFAIYKSKPVAGVLLFTYKKAIHYWGSVSSGVGQSLNATNLLLWYGIRWGQENRYENFNFGRTRPSTGVYRFKMGWRGREAPLPHFYSFNKEKSAVGLPDPEKRKFKLLSKVWKRMPTFLTREFGPRIVSGIAL